MIAYIKLLIYSCVFCILICFILGAGASVIIYIKNGYFLIPDGQLKRAIVFGSIAGTAITLATIVFNLIDKFNTRKSPPSDPN
ncbi:MULTISPECIES: hypothetical protein [Pantoea]|jgi:hypothetical protein|uniref:Uncharacterized protein n=1 Tax=Pantoea dispersa TaxID=59814 RepID=A0ABY3A3P4_9GAMM|nr:MULTISPECIES: hypothetical protein [Pantoea]KAA6100196.1 hypothetical protein F3I21_11875 [Pantoea sp. B_9]KAA6117000.1 hypothetical protein F3I18_00735 [Pantoea sp. B_10]MBK4773078.1 hypothetical protein [Pantoea sp. Morm]TQC75915.1 hypothetical protein FK492_08430 [Pantoea dispersa]